MYEWASDTFETAGYHQYEISNWAKENHQCRHNLQYWRGLPYLGLGAGAHGYANGYRYSNVLRIKTYIDRFQELQEFVNEIQEQENENIVSDSQQTNAKNKRDKIEFSSHIGNCKFPSSNSTR